ncbi:MAG: 30S ribosomal protein S13 [Candidatus Terraquivivens tikiterensis]|uniref:Small ribosomal subunit protein uS13 n=1 Tax=Candidatus Terraquivivens tikiterensis TaxID=1980982 RepID=A0A2R7Y549_9ARCH|nr:MAG: 30S ribosomal protein S13 [Candidatus Terraquivivens tikiterensis]
MSGEFKYVVRILGTDIDGSLKLPYALAKVKGIGINLGYAIARVLGLDTEMRIGYLTDQQLQRIEAVAKNPLEYGIPDWMINRNSPAPVEKKHLLGADLDFAIKEDIRREIMIKSWRGIRHSLGLKVRGQRTRTTGRTGTAVGVSRKEVKTATKKEKE